MSEVNEGVSKVNNIGTVGWALSCGEGTGLPNSKSGNLCAIEEST